MARIIAGLGWNPAALLAEFRQFRPSEIVRYDAVERGGEIRLDRTIGCPCDGRPGTDRRIVVQGDDLAIRPDGSWSGHVRGFELWWVEGGRWQRQFTVEGLSVDADLYASLRNRNIDPILNVLNRQVTEVVGTDRADDLVGGGMAHAIGRILLGGGNDTWNGAPFDDRTVVVSGGTGRDSFILANWGAQDSRIDTARGLVEVDGTFARIYGFESYGASAALHFTGSLRDERVRVHGEDASTLFGRGGDDVLEGLIGRDSLYGGTGDDRLTGSKAALLHGGEGRDTALAPWGVPTFDPTWAMIDLGREGAPGWALRSDWAQGDRQRLIGIEDAGGGIGGDRIMGSAGANGLWGGFGGDVLRGRAGNDQLFGGAGDDMLAGDLGSDRLVGGAGNDTIISGDGDRLVFCSGDHHDEVIHAGGQVTIWLDATDTLDSRSELAAALRETAAGTTLLHGEGQASVHFRAMTSADVLALNFVFWDSGP